MTENRAVGEAVVPEVVLGDDKQNDGRDDPRRMDLRPGWPASIAWVAHSMRFRASSLAHLPYLEAGPLLPLHKLATPFEASLLRFSSPSPPGPRIKSSGLHDLPSLCYQPTVAQQCSTQHSTQIRSRSPTLGSLLSMGKLCPVYHHS